MKIIKMKQCGKYSQLSFDDNKTFKLLTELCYQYSISSGEDISFDKLKEILGENENRMCMNSALEMLSRRIHSEAELKNKLHKKYKYVYVKKAIEECIRLKLLNDDYFTQCYVQELAGRGKGKFQIISSLKTKGIAKELIDKYIEQFTDDEEEKERAEKVALRKISSYRSDPVEKKRGKLTRHLMAKGYSYEIVKEVVVKLLQK